MTDSDLPPLPADLQAALADAAPEKLLRLARTLAVLGEAPTRALLAEAQAIMVQGGLMTRDGTPRSLSAVLLVLVGRVTTPLQQAQIYGSAPPDRAPAPTLTPELQTLAAPLGRLSRGQQAGLVQMAAVLGLPQLQALVAEAQALAAQGGLVTKSDQVVTDLPGILWRLVSRTATPEQQAQIFPQSQRAYQNAAGDALATRLGETAQAPRAKIRQLVHAFGMAWLEPLVVEAERMHATGTLRIANDSRPRSLGGIFFGVVKAQLTPEDRKHFFPSYIRKTPQTLDGPAPVVPAAATPAVALPELPALDWAVRRALYAELVPTAGQATAKVVLVGRPLRVVEKPTVVILAMSQAKTPAMPRGVPVPLATTATVYVARKQWAAVAAALGDPTDILVVEGVASYDPEMEGIVVSATTVTTKLLQNAKKKQLGASE